MPRDIAGNYTPPSGNPVQAGTTITSTWANTTIDDISDALTDSLDRNGRGGMLAPFQFSDGNKSSPGATWANEPTTGLYRASSGDLRVSVLGQDKFRFTSTAVNGAQYYDGATWYDVGSGSGGGGDLPNGGQVDHLLLWNGSSWQPGFSSAEKVTYDPGASGLQATNVNDAVDEVLGELDTVGTNLSNHVSDSDVHYADAPANGSEYVRRNKAWVVNSGGGGGVPEAPTGSGVPYVRRNSDWSDGNLYFLGLTDTASDSDLLEGENGAYYLNYNNMTGTVPTNDLSGTYNISISGNAATADSATSATTATNATNADNADNADKVDGYNVSVVASLPGTPDANTLYFITG